MFLLFFQANVKPIKPRRIRKKLTPFKPPRSLISEVPGEVRLNGPVVQG